MQLSKTMRKIGWLCFSLMWIPFAAGMIGMASLPEGSYDWSELPALTRYSILAGAPLVVASMVLLVGASIASAMANSAVLAKGLPAEARILSIRETGTTINRNPVVRLTLEVRPPLEPVFQAETERLVSLLEIPQFQPGTVVHVKYDPATHAVALLSAEEFEKQTNLKKVI
jgi:hypothetical protein